MVKVREEEKDEDNQYQNRPINDISENLHLNCHDNPNSIYVYKSKFIYMDDEEEIEDLNFTVIV